MPDHNQPVGRYPYNWLRSVDLRPSEWRTVVGAFLYFFSLLFAYYLIRPVRDEMGVLGGVDNLQWLFTGTFVVMLLAVPLFGAASARFPRCQLLPIVYSFFILNLLLFYALFQSGIALDWLARAFFVWVSVFNLFVVSVFWSFMADLFSSEQGKRLFGLIAAGGSLGAIAGPATTAWLVGEVSVSGLILLSAGMLSVALACVLFLLREAESFSGEFHEEPLQGHVLAGLTHTLSSRYLMSIALFISLYTLLSTFLYFEQAHIVKDAFNDSDQRTRVFALIDLAVNTLTVLLQLFVTGRAMQRFGVATTLTSIPALLTLGLAALALLPIWPVLAITQVVRRAGNYAFTRPAREVLFTVVSREDKYKAKNFIDTVVYRGGDAVSGWIFAGLKGMGLSLSAIAWVAVPFAVIWAVIGLNLGKAQHKRALLEENSHD